jgi:hypothetical protein
LLLPTAVGQALWLQQNKKTPPRPIREPIRAACSSILPIFFQGYNQDAAWRAYSSEKMCLNRQKDPL